MTRRRELLIFLACSLVLCAALFRGAMWGSTMLAPLDIAPTLFSKYRYIDPNAGEVPANHHIIDQLTYDLPLQYTIYQAVRRGEIPWWDPYTYGGRPLLADAHVNGTDPVRLFCYRALPFVAAYNWNLILKSILGGLAMFLLLRHLAFAPHIAVPFALTYQFAGCFAVFIGHPWIAASFIAYPLLWILWSKCSELVTARRVATAAVLVAWSFYCGNLQSHVYLPIFAACFLTTHAFVRRRFSFELLFAIGAAGLLGAMLAAPVLWPQLEFFRLSVRSVATTAAPSRVFQYLGGIASLATFFPWVLGTFRTLDVGKFASAPNAGFVLYLGSAAAVLCMFARSRNASASSLRLARVLVVLYFLICSTPLLDVLYTRIAPLAVMGLAVMAATGAATLEDEQMRARLRRFVTPIVLAALLVVAALNVFAVCIYPRIIETVRARAAEQTAQSATFDAAPALRAFQIANFPREISLLNPETGLALASIIALAFYVRRHKRSLPLYAIMLALNFLPVAMFFSRYVPHQPVHYWQQLLAGGPEQQRVAAALRPKHERLLEQAPGLHEMLFPNNLGHLQRIHTVHGYSALQPLSAPFLLADGKVEASEIADFIYRSNERGLAAGELQTLRPTGGARYRTGTSDVPIAAETLTTLTLSPSGSEPILRTDTTYPGWQASSNRKPLPIDPAPPSFTSIVLPPETPAASRIELRYQPTKLYLTIVVAGAALAIVVALSLVSNRARS